MSKKPTYEELEQRVKELEKVADERRRRSKVFLASDQEKEAILNNLMEHVIYQDTKMRILWANHAACESANLSNEKIAGRYCYEVWPKRSDPCSDCPVIKAMETGQPQMIEKSTPDGRYWFIRGYPFRDKNGDIVGGIEVTLEITERKRTEKTLEERTKKLNDILEKAADGICVCHNIPEEPNMKFTLWNLRMTEITGYTIDEINRLGWYQMMYSDPEVQKRATERMAKMRKGDDIHAEEWVITAKSGENKALSISTSIVRKENGKVHVLAVMQDITDRKQAEEAIRENERRYSALVQESPDAIISMDNTGNLLSFNTTAERISGFSSEEVVGKHFAKIGVLAKRSIPKALKEFALVVTGIERPPFELTIMNKDKSYFFMEANPRLIKQKRGKAWIQVTLRNITERKLAEGEKKKLEAQLQQVQKMESMGTLAGGIAHDFNNILGIIVGNTELAMDDVPEWNPARHNLEEIRTASIRARDVVKQILAFSRQRPQKKKPVRISPIIKESLKLLRSSIPTTIEIHQNISSESDIVRADPIQINQVLINLCTNAAHAMGEKAGFLEVSLEHIELDENSAFHYHDLFSGKYARLTVSDTGNGIEPKILKRIFDPYFTTKKVGEGSGMGLSVVHGIVKNHGGNISVISEPGKGTIFHILFPCIEDEPEPEVEIAFEIPRGNERILFVDDEKAMLNAIQPMIERLGYKVIARTSSIEALEAFRVNPDRFDLVITDFTMPNMTGIELAKEILKLRSDIPIILCTGYSEHINEDKSKASGVRAFLAKPVVLSEIANTIRKVLDDD